VAQDPWAIDNSGGLPAYSGQELRLTTVAPFVAGNGTALGARSGVRLGGSGTELLVQAQASPNMTVKVNPGIFVAQGQTSSTQGPYTWCLDTVTNLTISAAHATLARTDLIAVRIRDASIDTSGARDGNVIVITGTAGGGVPSLPTDASYYTIAQISVPAAVTNIGGGGGGTITDKRAFTAALGGVVPYSSSARATGLPAGTPGYPTDLGYPEFYDGAGYYPTGWKPLATTTLGANATTITFSSIPQTYRNLMIVASCKTTEVANQSDILMRFNNDSGTNYANINITADNGGASPGLQSGNAQTTMPVLRTAGANLNSTVWGGGYAYVLGYSNAATLAKAACTTCG
jgi:hypothetical protein